jgi:ribosomal protein S27AE
MKIYLYVKQHNSTKLKYFGKTQSEDPLKYSGSGKYWKRHLEKHGNDISNVNLWEFDNEEDCSEFAIKFSEENDIVNSKEWANLKIENGLDGNPIGNWKGMSYEEIYGETLGKKLREDRSKSNSNRKFSNETKNKISAAAKIRLSIPENNSMFGKNHSEESKIKIGKTSKNRKWSEASKRKFSELRTGKTVTRILKTCPNCGKQGSGPNMKRYHFDKCKVL